MSSTTTPVGVHPIVDALAQLGATLTWVTDTPAWGMSPAEQASVLVELPCWIAAAQELWLRVLAAGDRNDVAALTAATSTVAWLAHATVTPPGAAHGQVKLAAALDGTCGATREALAAGVIDVDRARVIVRAVEDLPEEAVAAEPGLPTRAEGHLLERAQKYDWKKLKALGRHLMEVLDPDGADERLGRQLEAEEARAARATMLVVRDNGDGTHTGRFKIGTLHAAMLKKMLDAILNPANHATGHPLSDPDAKPSRPEQLGWAFGQLLERLPTKRLPTSGGISATVVIHLDYDTLITGLGTATLDTGERISAGMGRRLACEAGVIPAVVRRLVDGESVVLDMGRERRFHTKHMRIALAIEQRGCTTLGCQRPPGLVRRSSRTVLGSPRAHQRRERTTAVPVPPHKGPRPGIRDDPPPRRQGPLPQTHVTVPRTRALQASCWTSRSSVGLMRPCVRNQVARCHLLPAHSEDTKAGRRRARPPGGEVAAA